MTDRESKVIAAVRAGLAPDLLSPAWRRKVAKGDHPTTGHCYVAAEATFHLLGGSAKGYRAMVASLGNEETHWWIEASDGHPVDPTAEQYLPDDPPYHLGRRAGFLTTGPSKRARVLMRAASKKLLRMG